MSRANAVLLVVLLLGLAIVSCSCGGVRPLNRELGEELSVEMDEGELTYQEAVRIMGREPDLRETRASAAGTLESCEWYGGDDRSEGTPTIVITFADGRARGLNLLYLEEGI